jgi:hypothetical protein
VFIQNGHALPEPEPSRASNERLPLYSSSEQPQNVPAETVSGKVVDIELDVSPSKAEVLPTSLDNVDYPVLPGEHMETVKLSLNNQVPHIGGNHLAKPDDSQLNVHLPTPDATQLVPDGVEELVVSPTEDEPVESVLQVELVPWIPSTEVEIAKALESSKSAASLDSRSTTNIKESIQTPDPVTPRTSKRLAKQPDSSQTDRSLSIVVDEPNTPKGHDASVELAKAAMDSPTKNTNPGLELRLTLQRMLRTDLPEFVGLRLVRQRFEYMMDVLAIVTSRSSEPVRAKNGPRHYQMQFNVTDPTVAPNGVTQIQIFRPYKEALPDVYPGDGILLRHFQAKSEKGSGYALRSDNESSWAVFKAGPVPEIKGPPVEFGELEQTYIRALKEWYQALDGIARAKLDRANGMKGQGISK